MMAWAGCLLRHRMHSPIAIPIRGVPCSGNTLGSNCCPSNDIGYEYVVACQCGLGITVRGLVYRPTFCPIREVPT